MAFVEWLAIHVMPAMQQVIARATNRVFVGLPLCLCTAVYHRCLLNLVF